jgi:N12 class adenine-specific DNA methylase
MLLFDSSLEEDWNVRYNSFVNPDYKKIPVFVDGMNTHKGEKEFDLLERQVEGISFLCNKGNGILVHEVGLGKTVQAEVATVNQIQTGRSKRPLVCVPKAVYHKWIKEFHQHFPDVTINELGNFSDKYIKNYNTDGGGLNITEGSISVCTYEALSKITFKDETIDGSLADDMKDSQTIYDDSVEDKRTNRQLAKEHEDIMEMLGKGSKSKEGSVFWENTGFDHITVDEIHNFKNVFGQARVFTQSAKDGESDRGNANEFGKLAGITPSDRAVKLFAITQLIQKENGGRNVFGLSATLFNNSPIEVYNILSLVARQKLKDPYLQYARVFSAICRINRRMDGRRQGRNYNEICNEKV